MSSYSCAVQAQCDAAEAELHSVAQQATEAEHAVKALRTQVHDLERASGGAGRGGRAGMFGGERAVQLLQAIQQNRRSFEREPIGPIGQFLGITDPTCGPQHQPQTQYIGCVCCLVSSACPVQESLSCRAAHCVSHRRFGC